MGWDFEIYLNFTKITSLTSNGGTLNRIFSTSVGSVSVWLRSISIGSIIAVIFFVWDWKWTTYSFAVALQRHGQSDSTSAMDRRSRDSPVAPIQCPYSLGTGSSASCIRAQHSSIWWAVLLFWTLLTFIFSFGNKFPSCSDFPQEIQHFISKENENLFLIFPLKKKFHFFILSFSVKTRIINKTYK